MKKKLKIPKFSAFFPAEKQNRQAVALELQGADNDVEALTGSSGRRVPRVVEAPQEALQLQRQDAMRDAEKMATQAGWELSGCCFFVFHYFMKNDGKNATYVFYVCVCDYFLCVFHEK